MPVTTRISTDGHSLPVSDAVRLHVPWRADRHFLGLAGATSILLFSPDSLSSLAIKLFETSEAYTLLAIPFFLLSGAFMTTGGVAQRLIDFANACVGHIRGGLAIAAVLACMLFAALSGSSPATVAAVGSIAVAGMVRSGYPRSSAPGSSATPGPWAS